MKKIIICWFFLIVFCSHLYAETKEKEEDTMTHHSILLAFHDIGWNLFNAVTYNYGINFIGAGVETLIFIKTGIDWKWRNLAYNHKWLSDSGTPALYLGYVAPGLAPVVTYAVGRFKNNEKLQIAGLALGQSLMLTLVIQTPLKMLTGRSLPGIVNELDNRRKHRSDNFSNEFNWFNRNFIGGWPSAHTANAFAAAATISEIYKDNVWLKVGVYSYAAFIGIGVTLNVHWASEAVAGALIGYAIGKTVGKSFNKLLEKDVSQNQLSFYVTPNTLGLVIKF